MQGRLNSFQKTMLQWNDLHPYNSVHVVRVPGPLDGERLQHVIHTTLQNWNLTGLTLNRDRGSFRYTGGTAACELRIVTDEAREVSPLAEEIERQLNMPFPAGQRFTPFRFFVVPAEQDFFLGLVVFHAIADGESLVWVMRALVEGYRTGTMPGRRCPPALDQKDADRILRHGVGLLLRKIAALPQRIRDVRHSCRPPCRDAQDLTNRFEVFRLEAAVLEALLKAGRAWEVTLNDLLLALLLIALRSVARGRMRGARRDQISVGCVVNTRKDLDLPREPAFGLFLGSFMITRPVPEDLPLRDLAQEVRNQTRAIKQHRLYLAGAWELTFGRLMCSLFSPEKRKTFYLKHHPLWGGLTNLNLNALWDRADEDAPQDYLRAVSTGPATPLVLSVTTVRDVVNLGLTYRPGIFRQTEVQEIREEFLNQLSALEERA